MLTKTDSDGARRLMNSARRPAGRRVVLKSIRAKFRLMAAIFLLIGVVHNASGFERSDVPAPLQAWIDWVLVEDKNRDCPFLYNNFKHKRCAWPSGLTLDLNDRGGRFLSRWHLFRDAWVELPGHETHGPLQVSVDARELAVIVRNGRPAVYLAAGSYELEGHFEWGKLPESLDLPRPTAVVALAVNGHTVTNPVIDAQGRLWLSRSGLSVPSGEHARNSEALVVMRKIDDDVPVRIETRIELDITGEPRELLLGRALLDSSIPIALTSPLPARLEANGALRLQTRPGRHVITIESRRPGVLETLSKPSQDALWPDDEVWAFAAHNDLRVVELEGLASVDPRQTRVPETWYQLPVFVVNGGDTLRVREVRRGDPDPAPDAMHLQRQLWLDFDGRAYTVQDRISGELNRAWRLEATQDLRLGQVIAQGQPRFITRLDEGELEGVELRERLIQVVADGRILRSGLELPAVGWAHDFQSVETDLHLPPGWDVFSVTGVDNVPSTWLSRWSLLDLFLVLVLAASVLRLWGGPQAVAALVMLVLIWHAPNAPHFVWLWIFIAVALLRVLPDGRIKTLVGVVRGLSIVALVLIIVPFVMTELRLALYPQLERPGPLVGDTSVPMPMSVAAKQSSNQVVEAPAVDEMLEEDIAFDSLHEAPAGALISKAAPRRAIPPPQAALVSKERGLEQLDPKAIVQTGPGIPTWRWRSIRLAFNGSVDRHQNVSIIYLEPWATTVMHVGRVVALVVVLVLLVGRRASSLGHGSYSSAVLAIVLVSLSISFAPFGAVQAQQYPDPALLQELRERLSEAPECLPQCAAIGRMRLQANAKELQIRLETHALAATTIVLPGHRDQWLAHRVLIDGAQAQSLARERNGSLHLAIPAGRHQVLLSGPLPERRRVQIALPMRPRAITTSAEDWEIRGIRADGGIEAQLELLRISGGSDAAASQRTLEPNQFPSFLQLHRTLRLGLDWTIENRLQRLASSTTAAVVDIPLLDGESVINAELDVIDGKVRVNLPRDVGAVSWSSIIEPRDAVTFVAPETTAWYETWRVQAGPNWHMEFDGLAPVHATTGATRSPLWRPWPGERVQVTVSKPTGVAGQTLTIDHSTLRLKPGKRTTDAELTAQLRSSQGGRHRFLLPLEAELISASIAGRSAPLKIVDGELALPLVPGTQQVNVNWRLSNGITTRFDTPAIDFGVASINHRIIVELGLDRWTLFTQGPDLGPAVLFWSVLAGLLLVAIALARLKLTPLAVTQWLLLAVGLSQVALPLAAVVVVWLLALGVRERSGGSLLGYRFNLVQIGLVVLTLASISILIAAIQQGLLGHPDMQVAGNGSGARQLQWYADRIAQTTPGATVYSVPLLVYRLLMLAWALWLALAILKWLRWAWQCFSAGGIWKPWRIRPA